MRAAARLSRRGPSGVCLVAAALLATPPAAAQSAVSFGAGFGRFAGPDFSELPAGPTLGVAIHLDFAEYDAEVAAGVDWSEYGAHGFRGRTRQLDYSVVLRKPIAGRPGLLAGGRVGYSTRSLSVVEEPARTDGFLIGPTLSLRTPTGLGPFIDVSLDAVYHTYEEFIMYGGREYGTDQDGFRVLLRVGVLVPLDGG